MQSSPSLFSKLTTENSDLMERTMFVIYYSLPIIINNADRVRVESLLPLAEELIQKYNKEDILDIGSILKLFSYFSIKVKSI